MLLVLYFEESLEKVWETFEISHGSFESEALGMI